MGVDLPRPSGWSGMLNKMFQKYFGPQPTRCKKNHGKIFIRFLVIIFLQKWVWPCHAHLGGPACSAKVSKIFWTTAYSMQKESWKNIHPFFCNNFLNKKWAWSCHAPRDVDQTSTIHLQNLLMYIELLQKEF